MPTFLSQLFDLPRQVRQGDFVLKLTDGVRNPEATLRDYVVTERLAKACDEAPLISPEGNPHFWCFAQNFAG
jgi:hypothetical protein